MPRGRLLLAGAALAVLVALIYGQVPGHDFVRFDDGPYVYENAVVQRGLTLDGIRWALTAFHASNWHPLTWLSHMLDCELYGLDPGAHHVSAAAIHALTAVLLMVTLSYLTGAFWRSLLVAALFAVHPLRVESVAWISERKDLLAGMFWVLTMLAYGSYARRPGAVRYIATLACVTLALLAKPMAVTLPFVLLLLDYWPLGRFDGVLPPTRLWLEKLPLFAASVASAAITVAAQSAGGSISSGDLLKLPVRIVHAMVGYVWYLRKSVWPSGLAFYYPHPALPSGRYPTSMVALGLLCGIGLGALTFVVVRTARRRPYLLTGWLWYLGTLLPVIGLIQVGSHSVADRYAYVPLIGVYVMIAWGLAELLSWRPAWRPLVYAAAGVLIVAFSVVAYKQVAHWRDSRALFTRAIEVTADNYLALNGLGRVLRAEGDLQGALEYQQAALRVAPHFAAAHADVGLVYKEMGNMEAAIRHYVEALRLRPIDATTHSNLGNAYYRSGDLERAAASYREALRIDPQHASAYSNLGNVAFRQGDLAAAAELYERALALRPEHADAHRNLGVVRERQGRLEEAIHHYRAALRLDPDRAEVAEHLERLLADAEAGEAPDIPIDRGESRSYSTREP